MRTKVNKSKFLLRAIGLILAAVIFFTWQNNALVITRHQYLNPKLPASFNNFTIVHLSDLHNKNFHGKLVEKIKQLNPDMIVFTGDLIDRRNTKIETAVEFVEEVVKIAPTYYVSGNHEQLSGEYDTLKNQLQALNVQLLDDTFLVHNKNGDRIGLMGLADPAIQLTEQSYLWDDSSSYAEAKLQEISEGIDTSFNILLSHRPELYNVYQDMKIDLVFSGHAHGGQIRIPFIGGLIAPNQGLLPEFTEGVYNSETTAMIVSRGLGNSIFPWRVFNRPELVVVSLTN